jgi:riboflavin synthase
VFTGIIEEIGEIVSIRPGVKSAKLAIRGKKVTKGSQIGDSIAVNGVCLTATTINGDVFTADVMAESMRRTALGSLKTGDKVNLERAMAADGRFGGHIVSGHIDGTGRIRSIEPEDNAVWVCIEAGTEILRLVIEKGSIAIDGISLTVAYVDEKCFKVSVIPHTKSETTLLDKKVGDKVNLENDVIGKYVEKLLRYGNAAYASDSKTSSGREDKDTVIDMEFLAKNGFV